MPATVRARTATAAGSSRPYERRSPTASPAQSEALAYLPLLPRVSATPHSHVSSPSADADADAYVESDASDADTEGDGDDNADADEDETPPDQPGLPTYAAYKRLEADYLLGLSPRKRDKALITQAMFDKIWDVLHQPEACTVGTPQFRFWVRKMFTLARPALGEAGGGGGGTGKGRGAGRGKGEGKGGGTRADTVDVRGSSADADADSDSDDLALERAMGIARAASTRELLSAVVLHEHRPVAIREQLYELFCYCHVRAGHGGRDKTCAVIRQHYAWVPKELTAQFVKACPTCVRKRTGTGMHGLGVGVELGYVPRRGRQREKRRVRVQVHDAAEDEPSFQGSSPIWPTTSGPLDPANPKPCGVREREREWHRSQTDTRTIVDALSPTSPVDNETSRTRSVPREMPLDSCYHAPGGWHSVVPRALTLDTSPSSPCPTTPLLAMEPVVHVTPFVVERRELHVNPWRGDRGPSEENKPSGLPLASTLSDGSLGDTLATLDPDLLALSTPGHGSNGPARDSLRPLRLAGPAVPPGDDAPEDAAPHLLQINPVLLSFPYPGMDVSGSSSDRHPPCPGGVALALRRPTGSPGPGFGYDQLHGSSADVATMLAMLETPDSPSVACACATGPRTTRAPYTLAMELAEPGRACGARYGYRDSLAMLLPCATDPAVDDALAFSILTEP